MAGWSFRPSWHDRPNGVLHCADSDIMISTGNEEHFKRICEVLDAPEMATDPRFETLSLIHI